MGFVQISKTPIVIRWYQCCYLYIYWIHTDAMITDARTKDACRKTQEDFFNNILPLTLLQVFERVVQGLHVRGSWRPNINCNILTSTTYDRHVVSFLFSQMLNQRSLGSTAGCWLSLWHLISIFSGPQTPSGVSEGPLGRVWPFLPHLVSSCLEFYWQLLWHPTQLNYIIIQRPHDRPLDL